MRIILGKLSHLKTIISILVESYYDSVKDARDAASGKIRTNECLVAVIESRVVGVLLYARNYSHYANYIEDIIVAKKHRRKGVATALLHEYVRIARKEQPRSQKYALSSTNVENKASIKMHQKFGFVTLGKLKELHYGRDEIYFGYPLR